ncbi:MAG: type II and III secretion system protein family protein [Rhodospirillales bacterium]|nr:type II and III secretion system protein family protein [Rhodospirillales bacterium]
MNKLILATIGAIAILTSQFIGGAEAQQVPGRPSAALAPLPIDAVSATQKAAEWVLTPDQDLVRVPLNKVVSVRLPGPVRNVVVANPDIADVILPQDGERAHVYVLARQVGSTTIVFEGSNGEILFQGDIQVDVDVAGIQAAIAEMLPDEKITVVSHRNSVFIKGFVRSSVASNTAVNVARKFVADPIEVINNLEVLGSQQVIMKVTVAEVKRTAVKQLGLNLTFTNGLALATASSASVLQPATPTFATATVTTAFGELSPLTIKALESENLAKTLAEPTLTALSGETASFLAGGSFPMPSAYDAATGTTTYVQTKFGIGLNFSPVVLDKGRISMHIKTTVSDRDTTVAVTIGGASVPGLTEKTTETTVELPSGGTLYLAGLLQNNLTNYVEGIPGLKNLPILGALFRSERFQNAETELVVSMTAYLAAPTNNSQPLAMPSDGFAPSGDLDFYLLGRLHKLYAHETLPPYATPLTGPYGYIME